MADQFVKPNFHVVLVHFPIALLIAGTLIELLGFLWPRHAFRTSGRWMILLGALSGIPAAISGIYALADVSLANVPSYDPWKEAAVASAVWRNDAQAHMLRDHAVLGSWGVGLAVLASILWLGSGDNWRNKLHLPLLALLLIACGLTVAGAWHAGEAVYRHGTAVQAAPTTIPSLSEPAPERQSPRGIEYFLPPLQTHMIVAGATIAMALASLGLSFRAANRVPAPPKVDSIAAALGPPGGPPPSVGELPPQNQTGAHVPVARFWLLAFLLGLLAALVGDWYLARSADTWNPTHLWELIRQPLDSASPAWLTRRVAHVGAGVSILALCLLMAVLTRVAPRARIALVVVSLLLLLVVAAQVWFGVLLTFDTVEGSISGFR